MNIIKQGVSDGTQCCPEAALYPERADDDCDGVCHDCRWGKAWPGADNIPAGYRITEYDDGRVTVEPPQEEK